MSIQLFEVAGVNLFHMKTMALILFLVFGIIAVGYLVGKISIKGVSLGSAAVFIVALFAGHFIQYGLDHAAAWSQAGGWDGVKQYFSMIQNMGLIFFVTAVGLIAGPTFFKNLVKNFKSYVLLGLVIILAGSGVCALITMLVPGMNSAMSVGLLAGALTSTPAFSAAQGALADSPLYNQVAVGLGVAYPFGVLGVVLFVQIVPKLVHADMDKERALLDGAAKVTASQSDEKLFSMDKFGVGVLALTIMIGIILGSISIPLGNGQAFSLGTTGGPLIVGLIFGHFGKIGKLSLKVNKDVLSLCQELGLILFLTGAGVDGGREFVTTLSEFGPSLFVWGVVMTLVPLLLGYVVARKVLKMSLFNTLGSLTGGMTSTPALGALINATGTSNVAAAYAATYPIALITVVLCAQLLTYL